MSAPGKLQRLKKYLEDNGLDLPDGADHGTRANKKNNVFRARRAYDEAVQALRDNDLDEATDAAHEMLYLLALQKINQPLVELDMAGKLISINIKILYRKNTANSQRVAKLWASGALMFNLRSFQLGTRMMSISARYPRHHPKRVLALRLATHCGHAAATREYRAQKRDEIANAELELEQIPDMDKYQWGRGTQMGQLVKRPVPILPGPPGPPVANAAAEPPLEVNQNAAAVIEEMEEVPAVAVAVIEDEQEMEEVPAAEQPSFPRQVNVVNRMDPKVWLVPYVSLSSDEEEDDSDEDVASEADTVILNIRNGEEDDDEDGNEESLAEASVPLDNVIKEARSLSVSDPEVNVITID